MYADNFRATHGGAAAVARSKFKVPDFNNEGHKNILVIIPATDSSYAIRCDDGRLFSKTLPSMNTMGEVPTPQDAFDLIDAELDLYNFEPNRIVIEWPAPPAAAKYRKMASIAYGGISMLARSRGIVLETISPKEIARAFGGSKAPRAAIEAAVRDFDIKYQSDLISQRGCVAVALMFTTLSRGDGK